MIAIYILDRLLEIVRVIVCRILVFPTFGLEVSSRASSPSLAETTDVESDPALNAVLQLSVPGTVLGGELLARHRHAIWHSARRSASCPSSPR